MKERNMIIISGLISVIGIILLFVMAQGMTGNYAGVGGYKSKVCSRAIPDTSQGFEYCWVDAETKCNEIHPKYISPTDKFNKCYNNCVFYARSLCYK